jgi:hypothetical protein
MKIYHAINEHSPDIPDKDKEKMSILKLVDVGKYVKNVGIRDGQFYVLADDATDEVYLEYREAMHNINLAMRNKIDARKSYGISQQEKYSYAKVYGDTS